MNTSFFDIPPEIHHLFDVMPEIAQQALDGNLAGDNKTGGFLCVLLPHRRNGSVVLVRQVLHPLPTSMSRWFCQEKCWRTHHSGSPLSSWETLDFEAQQYGGSVVFNDTSLLRNHCGFSGFSQHADEACVLVGLQSAGLISVEAVEKVIAVSENNSVYPILADRCDHLLPA